MLVDRLVVVLAAAGILGLGWFGWRFYKARLIRHIRVIETATGRPMLLYFSAEYCAPCKLQQTPIVNRLAIRLGNMVTIQKYDIAEHPELASRYKVLTLPTTVILNGQGQVVHINYGVTDQARLEMQLRAIAAPLLAAV